MKERIVRMSLKMKVKYAGSYDVIAAMLVFLLAAFLPGISYADNISPEMNRLTPVISLSQNQDGTGADIKPGTPDTAALENQNPFNKKDDKDNQFQEDRMKLLKPVDELLPPMDPEYGKMLYWADKIEQVAAEDGGRQDEELEPESKPVSLELLVSLDKAREAMGAGFEPAMNSEWIQAGMEDSPEMEATAPGVIESEDIMEYEPTQVLLTLGGGDFTVDYASSEQEDLMVKALQDLMADSDSGRHEEPEKEEAVRQERAVAAASVLKESGLRSEDQENLEREAQERNVPDAQVFSVFALPAPIDLGAQIAKQVEKMFFPAEESGEPAPIVLPEPPMMPKMDESARITEVLDAMTLAPPIAAESESDPALLAGEMGLLAPIPGIQRPEAEAGFQNSELKQVMKSELSVSAPERIAEAIDLIAPPEIFEPKAGGKAVGDSIPADLDEASKKMDESKAVSMAFPDVALKMALNSHQQKSLTSAPDTVGVFHKIVNEAMRPLVATLAPGVSKMVNEVSRAYGPTSFSFFFDDAPSRPTNFLEERFSFVSYVFPSVSYYRSYRSSSGYSSYSYGSNSDGSNKKRRYRYYF